MPISTLFSTEKRTSSCTQPHRAVIMLLRTLALSTFAALCYASEPTTTVYKKTMPDGSVAYSDQPSQSAKSMEVAPIPTIPAIETNRSFERQTSEKTGDQTYETLAVSSPENKSAFYSGDGSMNISVSLSPKLKPSHLMQFILDGAVVATQKSTALSLSRVDRGTHSLQINIINSAGKIVQSTQSSFTIHRPIARAISAP